VLPGRLTLLKITVLQGKLDRQQHNNEMERARLEGLITKLELQLTEQTREIEQVCQTGLSIFDC
jgi:hypothetical protein